MPSDYIDMINCESCHRRSCSHCAETNWEECRDCGIRTCQLCREYDDDDEEGCLCPSCHEENGYGYDG